MDQILHAREHLPVYDVAGPRDAFPIVLVHGAAATRKMWVPQLEALSEEFRVIAWISLVLAHSVSNHFSYKLLSRQ